MGSNVSLEDSRLGTYPYGKGPIIDCARLQTNQATLGIHKCQILGVGKA